MHNTAALRLVDLTPEHARDIASWRYPPPYERYTMDCDPKELLRPDDEYYAVIADDELVGFATFGDARVAGGDYSSDAVDIGYGLRPDLLGQRLGTHLVRDLLIPAARLRGPRVRTTVQTWNERAMRVVTSAGFVEQSRFIAATGAQFVVLVLDP